MPAAHITQTTFRVADFLSWQRQGQLQLSPTFQRRSVWNVSQKSYLIDTIARGLPVPIIFIRESIDLDTQSSSREVVDGQQRLRTLISFIDPEALPDLDEARDIFTVRKIHNSDIADKPFDRLPKDVRVAILGYEISTHVLPLSFEDRDVLQVFARMNSTGQKLNQQELRNAQYAGAFKTYAYELATEQLDRWRDWGIFSEDQVSRMREVDLVSDLLINAAAGLTGKSQPAIDKFYDRHDLEWQGAEQYSARFRHVMDSIDKILGDELRAKSPTAWRSEVNFFTLFAVLYDLEWNLGSTPEAQSARKLPPVTARRLEEIGRRIRAGEVPAAVLDAMQRASADLGRRRTRFDFVKDAIETR
ncbi:MULTISPECIES: DUF262 domain-containing protein [unclassified Rathayibacter]|uniref:DUF262 domain-containing protein n=1 Tax=unclassified Rathayibacter TaxID=2609250 RepID=UPI000CE8B79A|nr:MULTISPECIES: DUF262 domain-containing protein [unclassified Rathayibacter]PPF28427.1 hypothetical protein C5C54_06860 [Rathayibacter sp. AY1F2]PPH48363.1 hypothetical protein C5C42_02035 [Rathayibacter sp. AY1F7]